MTRSCTAWEKSSRSTASAVPPGTRAASAHGSSRLPERPQLGLEQPVRVGELDRFEGVAADELGQPVGVVRRRLHRRPHLVQRHPDAALRERPGRLRAGETAADDGGVHASATSSGSASDELVAALEAGAGLALGLADLLLHADPAALGTGVGHRPVPGGEVARRIAHAAPERLAPLGAPLGEIALDALGALDAERDGAGALARRGTSCRRGTRRTGRS